MPKVRKAVIPVPDTLSGPVLHFYTKYNKNIPKGL